MRSIWTFSLGGTGGLLWKSRSLRVEGRQPCPQAGYWATPAQLASRRLFQVRGIMPTFENSKYGATIWQWSEEQRYARDEPNARRGVGVTQRSLVNVLKRDA